MEKRPCLLEGGEATKYVNEQKVICLISNSVNSRVLSAPLQTLSERVASDCIFVPIRDRKEILVNRGIIVTQSSLNALGNIKKTAQNNNDVYLHLSYIQLWFGSCFELIVLN